MTILNITIILINNSFKDLIQNYRKMNIMKMYSNSNISNNRNLEVQNRSLNNYSNYFNMAMMIQLKKMKINNKNFIYNKKISFYNNNRRNNNKIEDFNHNNRNNNSNSNKINGNNINN